MKTLTVSSTQFHEDDSEAWAASESSPVIIIDQRPRVLLLLEDFEKMSNARHLEAPAPIATTNGTEKKFVSIAEALAMPDGDDFDFDPPRSRELARGWDFS